MTFRVADLPAFIIFDQAVHADLPAADQADPVAGRFDAFRKVIPACLHIHHLFPELLVLDLGLLGGIMGILLGIGLSFAVEYVRGQPFTIQASACVVAFVFSVFVGVFFGLNPASRAAKLDPVEALAG